MSRSVGGVGALSDGSTTDWGSVNAGSVGLCCCCGGSGGIAVDVGERYVEFGRC